MVKESGKGSEKGSGNGKIDIKDYTRFEIARIVGARALQISMDAPILVKLGKGGLEELNYDPLRIARKEFEKGILPITVRRPFPVAKKE